MNDEKIKQIFLLDTVDTGNDTNRFERRKFVTQCERKQAGKYYQKKLVNEDAYEYIMNRYSDSSSISETLYRIAKGIEKRPVCKNCGKEVEFQGLTGGFKDFCCSDCRYEYKGKQMRIHPEKKKQAEEITSVNDIDDKFILKFFIDGKTPKQTSSLINSYNMYDVHNGKVTKKNTINMNIYEYLKNRYSDSTTITETIYRIKHNINNVPVCPICRKRLPFVGLVQGYREYCSRECYVLACSNKKFKNDLIKHNNYEKQLNITYKETIGKEVDDNVINEIFFKDKTYKEQEIIREHYLKQHNYRKLSQTIKVYSDVINYINNRFNDSESFQETLYRLQNKLYKRPICPICGKPVSFSMKFNKGFYTYCSYQCQYEAHKDNLLTAFNPSETSNSEKGWMIDFKEIFDGDIVTSNMSAKSEYKDERYPYKYDFYIKEVDLFIEYQGFNTHGVHPYRGHCDDTELIEMIDRLDEGRANKIKYVWTESDVEKRRTAKQNNINFLELWPKDFYGKKRHKIITDGLREMKGKTKEEIQNIIKRISLHESIYDENIYLGE